MLNSSMVPSSASWPSTDEGVHQPTARDQDSIIVATGDEPGQLVPAGREPLDCVEEIRADELSAAGHAATWSLWKGCINGVEDFVGDDNRTTVSHRRRAR